MRLADGFTDILWIKTARQHPWFGAVKIVQQCPIEADAIATGERGVLRRLGVKQQAIRNLFKTFDFEKIGFFTNADGFHHRQAEPAFDVRDAFGRLGTVKLQQIGL